MLTVATAPTLRAQFIKTPAAISRRLDFGEDVLAVDDLAFLARDVLAVIDRALEAGGAELPDTKGRSASLLPVEPDGSLAIRTERRQITVLGLRLAATDRTARAAELDAMLKAAWLGAKAEQRVRAAVAAGPLAFSALQDLQAHLAGCVEAHIAAVEAAVTAGEVDWQALSWSDPDGLERLIGIPHQDVSAVSLGAAVRELGAARLRRQRGAGVRYVLAAAIEPDWAAHRLPSDLSVDEILREAWPPGRLGDPFAGLSALDLLQSRKGRFRPGAIDLVERYQAQFEQLDGRFNVFAGTLLAAFAALSQAPRTREAPVLWRRSAAYAVASLHSRALAYIEGEDAETFFRNSRAKFGRAFDTAVAYGAVESPRWHPMLATPVAIRGLWWRRVQRLAETATNAADKAALAALSDRALAALRGSSKLAILYPGPADGMRDEPVHEDLAELADAHGVKGVVEAPRSRQWVALANCILISPPTEAMRARAVALVQSTTTRELIDDDGDIPGEVAAVGMLLACSRDAEAARQLAAKLVAAASAEDAAFPALQTALALITLAAAQPDNVAHERTLRETLEALAFGLKDPESGATLVEILDILAAHRPALIPLLGRAMTAAKLVQEGV